MRSFLTWFSDVGLHRSRKRSNFAVEPTKWKLRVRCIFLELWFWYHASKKLRILAWISRIPKNSHILAYFRIFFWIGQPKCGLKWFLRAKKLMWDSLDCFAGLQPHFKAFRPLFRPKYQNSYFGRNTAGIMIRAILGPGNVSYGPRAFICTPRDLYISSRTHFKPI